MLFEWDWLMSLYEWITEMPVNHTANVIVVHRIVVRDGEATPRAVAYIRPL